MKALFSKLALFVLLFVAVGTFAVFQSGIFNRSQRPRLAELEKIGAPNVRSSFSPHHREDAHSRHEYEMRRLRDPQTGLIPQDIRAKELAFVRQLPARESLQKNGGAEQLFAADWVRRGPINVGGRTRALAIDLNYNGTSNRRILAGGVSGGMFLSTDDGATWQMTTTLAQFPSATCVVQDPNNRNTWYYGTGELTGSTRAGVRSIPGQGIFKSTDGGMTWAQLPATRHASPTQFDGPFDFVWNLAIRPQDGAIFAATLGAILRSTDGGNNWAFLLVGQDVNNSLSLFSDVAIAANGDVYATLSRNGLNLNNQQYGVFRSTDGGNQFTVITPTGLVADPYRMVLATAPSDANTLYLLVQANGNGAVAADHQLFRYNVAGNTWTDLSASLPDAPGLEGNASFSSQGGYDLIVKVKPNDPNVVWIGGTNLYRSIDGGQNFTLVGGYFGPDTYAQFANHHSDQHAVAFFPNNSNAMISGNDGGLSKTTNVLAQPQTWTSLNNGYVATQFYTIAVDPQSGSDFIIGGTQDNGSWGTDVNNFATPWASLLSGDGAYTDIVAGGNTFYVSAQQGVVIRGRQVNNQLLFSLVQPVTPNGKKDFLFIAPFQLDPNNPLVMYLAVANGIWRNSNLDSITVVDNQEPVTTNWSALDNSAVPNTQVTTLAVSKTPANRLYFGATDYQNTTILKRVDNAPGNPAGTIITPPGVPGGAYPSCIAVNPNNGDEIFAAFSNYALVSLWYSANGGASWTDVEGNLAGDEGPSIRWATIVPTGNSKVFLLATSTGIYSTTALNGANTAWVQEGSTPIGNAVVDMIAARPADGLVVAGSHGRGVYSAQLAGAGVAVLNVDVQEVSIQAKPGETGTATFSISNSGTADLSFNITASGPTQALAATASGVLSAKSSYLKNAEKPARTKILSETQSHASPAKAAQAQILSASSPASQGVDALILDDGNNSPDDFIGLNGTDDFFWMNRFTPSGFGFRLESFVFFMRTEGAFSNPVYVGVLDANLNVLIEAYLDLITSQNGTWYTIMIDTPPTFADGETFFLQVGASYVIYYPAGADKNAGVSDNSFFFNPLNNQYVPLGSIAGFENGAFLIRAFGTKTGVANQPPVALGTISKSQANVNETITFDASPSFDLDGQITKYLWNFGDGGSSNQKIATHAYTQAGAYTFTLTVTDNADATGQTSGQINITAAPSRLTVSPVNGVVTPGNGRLITVAFDANGLPEGNYQGQLDIMSNGGNSTLPVHIVVSQATGVDERANLPRAFRLEQNYPNPFSDNGIFGNPETAIRFNLPSAGTISLSIHDVRGALIKTLQSGNRAAGEHVVRWDGRDSRGERVASGIYFYRLEAVSTTGATTSLTRKLTVMK